MEERLITVIIGPGHHGKELVEALQKNGYKTEVFTYWPHFTKTRGEKVVQLLSGKVYDFVTILSYAVKHRLQKWLDFHWPLDHLLSFYDSLVSNHLNTKSDMLIGWPQVSLQSFKKWKRQGGVCILEHPMIHVKEWMAIMEAAYKLVPHVTAPHGLFTKAMQRRMLQEYELADRINVLSNYAYDTFIQHGVPKEKLHITNLSVDTETFHIIQPDYPADKFVFLFVGRLEILKGVHLLVNAFNALDIPNAELWLVGDMRPEIIPFIKGEKVKWMGVKSKGELVEIYNRVNCLVLPSLQESYGLVLLEAMATGLPVIASSKSGGWDIIDKINAGIIFQANSIEDLKSALKKMNEEFSYDKREIRKKVTESFSLGLYGEAYKSLISESYNSRL